MKWRLRAAWMWLGTAIGKLLNTFRVPGFVRAGRYKSRLGDRIRVRVSPLFTVITVRGLNLFFDRLTGRVDGVGLSQARYTPAGTPGSDPHAVTGGQIGRAEARNRNADTQTD